ncbi:hypothetical protein [Candidatus Electronema sp. JM]|uniref:hypothetical protein n=1 Tax=Candidatus Electronema sp. JM TaxID=3401571 RepID=UPI003AA8814A
MPEPSPAPRNPAFRRPQCRLALRCGLLTLLAFFVFACCEVCWFFIRERKMQDFCGQIAAGMPQEAVIKLAAAHGHEVSPDAQDENSFFVVDRKAMGRFICAVRLEQGRVTAAQYVSND